MTLIDGRSTDREDLHSSSCGIHSYVLNRCSSLAAANEAQEIACKRQHFTLKNEIV